MNHSNPLMPLLFLGHGSPMLALSESLYSFEWKNIAQKIRRPEAIVVISAHWVRDQRLVTGQVDPPQIFDFYGFPEELYKVKYKTRGNPELAKTLGFELSYDWGIDHGAWCVLKHMYPEADIPVIQVSLKRDDTSDSLLKLGEQLKMLRSQNVLIIGSGNIVHNLGRISFQSEQETPLWASDFEEEVLTHVRDKNFLEIQPSSIAHPSPEHLWPLLVVLGAVDENDSYKVFNQRFDLGSIAMTSLCFQ